MRILVVEDEEKISGFIAKELKAEGFAVDIANDGATALELALSYNYDAIILDILLPKLNGIEVLAGIRSKNRQVPIIMLTAKDAVADKVQYIGAGADDYLTKPFAFPELLVRLRSLIRRNMAERSDMIRINDLEIDRLGRQVKRAGRRIELSAKEYALLEYMALNADQPLSRVMIVKHVWDQSFEGFTNIVEVFIRQLRAKIDEGHPVKLIKTVRGIGYTLNDRIE